MGLVRHHMRTGPGVEPGQDPDDDELEGQRPSACALGNSGVERSSGLRMGMSDMIDFLRDMRNAAFANGAIVLFHIYVAFFLEGLYFLIPVVIVGGLVAGAYYTKGKVGAGLLAVPTLGYILLVPELINALSSENNPGVVEYVLIPFWMMTIVLNLFVIQAEWSGMSDADVE